MSKYLNIANDIKIGRSSIEPLDANTYLVTGQIAKEEGGTFSGVGDALLLKISEHLMQIDYCYYINTKTNLTKNFYWGLNADLLQQGNSKLSNIVLTPIGVGLLEYYDSTWQLLAVPTSYGGWSSILTSNRRYWVPSRNYTLTGTISVWSSAYATEQNIAFIKGTCYAQYTEAN